MAVQIIHGDAVHQTGSHDAAMIIRVARRVDRDKDIRHDTSAAIHDTFRFQRVVLHRVGEMNTVRAHQLASVVAVDQVVVVLLLIAVFIRFLDGTARRRIIAGNRQADHRTVRHRDRFLYQPFPERAAAYDHASIPILHCAGKDFTGGCGCFVYQHDQASLFKVSASRRLGFFARLLVSFGINDQLVLAQKLVGQVDRDVQISPAVSLQIEDQVFHSLFLQFLQGFPKFVGRRSGKAVQFDVSGSLICHVSGIQAVYRNFSTRDLELDQVGHSATQDLHPHFRVLRAAQAFHHIRVLHLDAGNQRVVHHDDAVASHQADLFRRSAGNYLDHI